MSRQLRIEFENASYHVMSCGNTRSRIFRDDTDRMKFLSFVETACLKHDLIVHCYCLMNNHYHLFVTTPSAGLSKAMYLINFGYTRYYNKRHKRAGHLFAGRYRACIVDTDNYALVLSAYIHLNPVRAGITDMPWNYDWSSCRYYTSHTAKIPGFIDTSLISERFGKSGNKRLKAYREFLIERAGSKGHDLFDEAKAGLILGDDKFLRKIKEQFIDSQPKSRDLPALHQMKKAPAFMAVLKDRLLNYNWDNMAEKQKFTIYLLRKHTGASFIELQRIFPKLSVSAISQIIRRMSEHAIIGSNLYKQVSEIETVVLSTV
ncbi:MAG: transposase [Candidatus Wallbacteria bacterium]|nr:transposase [Candidatus Wallbacteria bacterium]